MTDPQPGHISVIFDVHFDKLAPSPLRSAIVADCGSRLDQLVPPAVRQTWLNKPYTGGSSAEELLTCITKLFNDLNPAIVPIPTPKEDFYCWIGVDRRCYSTFALIENGEPVTTETAADGFAVACTLVAILVTVPPES